MKSLTCFITESIDKQPKTREELQDMLLDMLNKGITNFNSIDVSKITNMTLLFSMPEFEDVEFDVSEWDVSHVTNMENMFTGCSKFNRD